MLESVDVFPRRRAALRRTVDFSCEVVCDLWDEPIPHRIRELSTESAWLEAEYPLEPETDVVVVLSPPNAFGPFYLFARVERAELGRRPGDGPSGFALRFLEIEPAVRESLELALAGYPPPLPSSLAPAAREYVWVNELLTLPSDDGTEVSDVLGLDGFESGEFLLDEAFAAAESLAPLQTTRRFAS